MRNILITGQNSYVGTSLKKYLSKWPDEYKIDAISLRDDAWKKKDFSQYDVIYHVAAVVHKKEKPEMKSFYDIVNKDLPIEVATKAKNEGTKQFIFMSTMAVYGENGNIDENVVLAGTTKTNPKTYYGQSKLLAEIELNKLDDDKFKVVILRPPMIYGPNCPGNYSRLEKLANIVPIFPMIDNHRSMLHIDKLSEYVKGYIDNEREGLFLPQDDQYVNTSLLVQKIAKDNGKKIYLSKALGLIVKLIGKRVSMVNKIFGNLVYEK
ncbi:MAG TPA: NAD-dependent epimerase/dehydratase family protein [Clostridium sp.]